MEGTVLSELADWIRTLTVAPAVYLALVVVLRVSGKRTLAKLNAFDLVVTVALGSLLASAAVESNVGFVQAALAIGLLVALQAVVSWSSARWGRVRQLVTATPTALVVDGQLRH